MQRNSPHRLPKRRDVLSVTSERRDVVTDPFECQLLVLQSPVPDRLVVERDWGWGLLGVLVNILLELFGG